MTASTSRAAPGVPRVDLTPPRVREARARAAAVRVWGILAGIAAAATLVAVIVATALLTIGHATLLTEQERGQRLAAERASLTAQEVSTARRDALEEVRAETVARDLEWRALHGAVAGRLPEGVALAGFSFARVGDEAIPGARGRLVFTAKALAARQQTLDAMGTIPGIVTAALVAPTAADDEEFAIDVDFDATVLVGSGEAAAP